MSSYWKVFRPCFVLFHLYLIGDAFHRWDGFSYYASFYEFLPAVALSFILWSIVAVLTAILVWVSLRIFNWAFQLIGLKIGFEHLLIYIGVFILLGALIWKGKKIIWPYAQTTLQVKLIVLVSIVLLSVLLTRLFNSRTEKTITVIHERITPLVWLFGFCVISSVPLVAYYTWWKTDKMELLQDTKSFVTDDDRPNIILVTFDALAAREMSLYGYPKETTPFISKWAKNATVFSRAEAASNFTTPAAASLMTGKRVWTHQTYHINGAKPVRSNVESLPFLLKDNGYFNMAYIVNPFASVKVLGMSNSFDIAPLASEFGNSDTLFGWKFGIIDKMLYQAFGDKIRLHNWIIKNDFILSKVINLISRNISKITVPPDKVFNRFLKIIDSNTPKPFFAWIHVFPPHDPYLPPEPFKEKYNPSSELRAYKSQENLIEESYKYLFRYQPFPEEMQPTVDLMRDYYNEFTTYIDRTFEDFIAALKKRNITNTIIMLTADHGESFDHGYFTHGGPFLYEQVTHIPLIIQEPSQLSGQVISDFVEQIDIPATILDLANIAVPSWMEGRSLLPIMRGETLGSRPAFSMNFEENRSRGHQILKGSIAVWDGDYKLIHYLGKNKSLLFNLKQDPYETDNFFDKDHKTGSYLLGLIKENLNNVNKKRKNN